MSNSRCGQTTGHPASLSTASAAQPPAEASRPAAAWGHGTSAGMHAASQHSSDEQYTPRTLQQTESTLPFAALAANSSSKPSSNIVDIDDVNMQRQHAGRQHHKHSSHRSSSSQQAQYQDAFLGDAATTAKQPRTNEVSIDDIGIGNTGGHASRHPSAIARLQQGPSAAAAAVGGRSPFRPLHRPVGSEMLDFPSGDLDLVRHLNLDGIFLDKQVRTNTASHHRHSIRVFKWQSAQEWFQLLLAAGQHCTADACIGEVAWCVAALAKLHWSCNCHA
eukprot:GHRR01013023.1.p1 GENE.GHRR01013023.1~~GHRR01013023.1.p1  ORF type:complete len:276 (+),score=91.06 GHRR01013023.1:237-1064(+)